MIQFQRRLGSAINSVFSLILSRGGRSIRLITIDLCSPSTGLQGCHHLTTSQESYSNTHLRCSLIHVLVPSLSLCLFLFLSLSLSLSLFLSLSPSFSLSFSLLISLHMLFHSLYHSLFLSHPPLCSMSFTPLFYSPLLLLLS